MNRSLGESGAPLGFEQPRLIDAVWRYKWLVALIVTLFVAAGFVFESRQPTEYEAAAELIVEDPRASELFQVTELARPSTQSSERYLADQVEILRSIEVASVASEMLDGEFSGQDILSNRHVSGELTSNLIEVSFRANSPEGAKRGADAIADSYIEVRRRQVQETAAVALAKVDALSEAVDEELQTIDAQLEELTAEDEDLIELRGQFEEARSELSNLRIQRDRLPLGSVERAQMNDQIAELLRDFETWEVILRSSLPGVEADPLLAQREAALAERAALASRHNSIEVDAELAAGGVTLFSRAPIPGGPLGSGYMLVLAEFAVLGAAVAVSLAYYLALRRKRLFSERYQPEVLLDAPLLSAIPDFEDEDLNSLLPVSDAPYSRAAEASRFLASSLDMRLRDAEGRRSGSRDRRETALVAFTSATLGDGKTTVSANAAAASALQGRRVLSVDADFGHQALSEMLAALSDSPPPPAGITEVASQQIELADAIMPIDFEKRGGLHLLSRGSQIVTAPDFFNSAEAQTALRRAGKEFDLVFIDTPPMLEVAYASALLRLADFVVVVVPHGSPMGLVEEMRKRIELIGTPLAGYVYNKASHSRGVVTSEGSMRDVLGGVAYPTKTTHSRWQWARPWLPRVTAEEPHAPSSDTVPAQPNPGALSRDPFDPVTDPESDGD